MPYLFKKEIKENADKFKLDPCLVAAIVYAESNFDPCAMRFEENYRWLYKVKFFASLAKISIDTETAMQKFSYGLMQIMGAAAKERGYHGFLPELCTRPELGLYYGCMHFQKGLKRYGYDVESAIAAYNAGSPIVDKETGKFINQKYVDKIMSKYEEYKDNGHSSTTYSGS